MTKPIGPIPIKAQTPSILTSATDQTRGGFGASDPVPSDVDPPDGALPPFTAAWRSGVSWVQACQLSNVFPLCPDPENSGFGDPTPDAYGHVESAPFWVSTPLACEWSTMPNEVYDRTRELTIAHTPYGMGRALWMGAGFDDPFGQMTLRNTAVDVSPGGAATDLDDAVALLLATYEQETQGEGGQLIHMPGIMVTSALGGVPGGGFVMKPEGDIYRGPLGSIVSPGPGYPWGATVDGEDGAGPLIDSSPPAFAGNEADEVWVYISGPVEYALSDVLLLHPDDATGARTNTVDVWAVREAIYRFEPCKVWAAKALLPVTLEGS